MPDNPYKAPESKLTDASEPSAKPSLSRATGKKKLLVGVPATLICGVLAYYGILPGITRMLAVILGAYAIVGLVEIIGGDSLASLAKSWDSLPAWKKFIFSIVIIIVAFAIFIAIAMNIAKFIQ